MEPKLKNLFGMAVLSPLIALSPQNCLAVEPECDVCLCYVAFEGAECRGQCDFVWHFPCTESVLAYTFISNCQTNHPDDQFGQGILTWAIVGNDHGTKIDLRENGVFLVPS